jgi:hypothetical protein
VNNRLVSTQFFYGQFQLTCTVKNNNKLYNSTLTKCI